MIRKDKKYFSRCVFLAEVIKKGTTFAAFAKKANINDVADFRAWVSVARCCGVILKRRNRVWREDDTPFAVEPKIEGEKIKFINYA